MKPANHVTNLKCFPQVAAVIGHAKAQHELFLVALSLKHLFDTDRLKRNCDICYGFIWDKSPQGYGFWSDVSEGKNPYKANA